jgi:hypothetical protein
VINDGDFLDAACRFSTLRFFAHQSRRDRTVNFCRACGAL